MSSLAGLFILWAHLVTDVVLASSGEGSGLEGEPFRLAIILVIVAILLCVAAVIVCRFACVNFCSNGGYKKVDGDEDDNPKEVKVEAPPVSDEVEDLDSDSEVKQPLPESDPPESPEEAHEDLSPSPSLVVRPPRYSNVASLPRYSEAPPIPEEKPEETTEASDNPASPTGATAPMTEKEIENDKKEKAENEKEPVAEPSAPEEPVALTDDELALSSGEPEEEPRSSGDDGGATPDVSNGTPPPPYAEARSRGGSEDRLDDISESSNSPENSAPVDDEIAHIADTSSDSENMLDEAACNAPTLERPHVMNIDEPDAASHDEPDAACADTPRRDSTTRAAPPPAFEEGCDEVDGHCDSEDDGTPSPVVPLDPVVRIESPGGADESFDMDDYTPLPPTLRGHRLSGSDRGHTM